MREQIDQLWYALVGFKGGGLIDRVDAINERLDLYIEHRAATCPINLIDQADERKASISREKRRINVQTIALIVAGLSATSAILIAILKP